MIEKMYTALHIDRKGSLKSGMIIEPIYQINNFGVNGLSSWGVDISNPPLNYSDINTLNIEAYAESVRKELFQDSLSRLSAFFALRSIDDLELWRPVLNLNGEEPIYMVYYNGASTLLDARWLNQNATNDPLNSNPLYDVERLMRMRQELKVYWSGIFTDNPLPELLIQLPVRIGERVM